MYHNINLTSTHLSWQLWHLMSSSSLNSFKTLHLFPNFDWQKSFGQYLTTIMYYFVKSFFVLKLFFLTKSITQWENTCPKSTKIALRKRSWNFFLSFLTGKDMFRNNIHYQSHLYFFLLCIQSWNNGTIGLFLHIMLFRFVCHFFQ